MENKPKMQLEMQRGSGYGLDEWFMKGVCDGFAIQPDVSFGGIRNFVDQVIPILQKRGLFHEDYEGTTLRVIWVSLISMDS